MGGNMRLFVLLLVILSFALVGCATDSRCRPSDKVLWEKAIKAADDARVSAKLADDAVERASKEADRAAINADRASSSADRAAGAASVAEDAAEKSVKAFDLRQRK